MRIDVLFRGVCHSDIHQVKNEWANTVYPCMPGHEIVGRVVSVGDGVTLHTVGDIVGAGCMIDSCRACEACRAGEENYCVGPNSWLATYNGPMVPAAKVPDRRNTYERDSTFGGYSTSIVVKEDFTLKIPQALAPEKAAPILCAGVTTYSPMKHWGVLEEMEPVNNMPVAFKRRSVAGSLIGSIAETQEVLDVCAQHGIAPDIQVISIEEIKEAFERVERGEVRFRYVIDLGSLREG